jgi:hypothetical protein
MSKVDVPDFADFEELQNAVAPQVAVAILELARYHAQDCSDRANHVDACFPTLAIAQERRNVVTCVFASEYQVFWQMCGKRYSQTLTGMCNQYINGPLPNDR